MIKTLNLPFLLPRVSTLILLAAASMGISILTGIAAGIVSMLRAINSDIQNIMRGE